MYPEKFIRDNVIAPFLLLFVVILPQPIVTLRFICTRHKSYIISTYH